MPEKPIFIPVNFLRGFIKDTFLALGVPPDDAETCTDVIIAADIRGIESHGINRLKYYYDRIRSGQNKVISQFEIVRESPTTTVVDGHHGLGMVISKQAMQIAIDKAGQYGMGSVAVRNSTHFGIAGYYPLMAVQQDMIGMAVTNTSPAVSPTFGIQPILGTNPIAFGAPTDEPCPFLFDGATPIIPTGKVEVYARKAKPMPDGWVIDLQNESLTDPVKALASLKKDTASLLPLGGSGEQFGGHKGYGLGTIVEVLSASLQQGTFLQGLAGIGESGEPEPFRVGHFFMAINIESYCSVNEFKASTGQIMRDLRKSQKAPGEDRIYTAGEKEFETQKKIRKNGVPIVPNLQKEILFLQKELNLTQYEFLF
jgi:L-2-hydroxycarboxylate dehydrogenase (NAD+)